MRILILMVQNMVHDQTTEDSEKRTVMGKQELAEVKNMMYKIGCDINEMKSTMKGVKKTMDRVDQKVAKEERRKVEVEQRVAQVEVKMAEIRAKEENIVEAEEVPEEAGTVGRDEVDVPGASQSSPRTRDQRSKRSATRGIVHLEISKSRLIGLFERECKVA